jgi:DNA-binding beta-propeller fold protein YncE
MSSASPDRRTCQLVGTVREAEMGVAGGCLARACLALLLTAGIAGCEVPGMPSAGRTAGPAGPVTVYVANAGDDTVTPIRAASNTAGRPIKVGPAPALIAISPDGQTAYVVGVGTLLPGAAPVTLTPVRTATNRPGRVITVCASANLGGVIAQDAIAITPDSRTVYVSCPGEVVPVRAGTDAAARPIRVSSAGALAMAAAGRTVYVANPDGDTITPISTATDRPGPPIVVGPSPDAMAVTPDGRTVLVLTSGGVGGVTPVDTATNRARPPVAIRGAYAVAVAPGGSTAYVLAMPDPGSQQGFVVPVRLRTSTTGTPIKVGLNPVQIAFTPDGTMAYVANYASANVTPIQFPDGRAGPSIGAGKIPARLAVSPDGTTVYVIDSNIFGGLDQGIPCTRAPCAAGRVIPIRVATDSAGRPIEVGRFPIAIAIAS